MKSTRPVGGDVVRQGVGLDVDGEIGPTWDLYREMAGSTEVNAERRRAVLWALDELERRMGPDWLDRYWRTHGHVPQEVNLGAAHLVAFGHLLDLALRYFVLDSIPGIGQVQREMRRDLRDDRRWHSVLQLEVAALATRAGFTAALEARNTAGGAPSDVVVHRDDQLVRAETFVVLRDQRSQETAAYWDWLMAQIRTINWRTGAGVSGDLSARLDPEASAELLKLIEAAAELAARTGQEQAVHFRDAQLQVLPPGHANYELRGGIEESQGWPRIERKLVQKARQASRAGGGWLRADVRDGMWQFTPWARSGLRAKIDEISCLITPILTQIPDIDGAVLSGGMLFAQGEFYGESAAAAEGCYALRRVLPALRVRETVIVPVTAQGRDQARIWRDLYNDEEKWLDWALLKADLPQRSQIFPAARGREATS